MCPVLSSSNGTFTGPASGSAPRVSVVTRNRGRTTRILVRRMLQPLPRLEADLHRLLAADDCELDLLARGQLLDEAVDVFAVGHGTALDLSNLIARLHAGLGGRALLQHRPDGRSAVA